MDDLSEINGHVRKSLGKLVAEMTRQRDALRAELAAMTKRAEEAERELADGSFYKEADIDRMLNERDAAIRRAEKMQELLNHARLAFSGYIDAEDVVRAIDVFNGGEFERRKVERSRALDELAAIDADTISKEGT